jgi:hypothetical protein
LGTEWDLKNQSDQQEQYFREGCIWLVRAACRLNGMDVLITQISVLLVEILIQERRARLKGSS